MSHFNKFNNTTNNPSRPDFLPRKSSLLNVFMAYALMPAFKLADIVNTAFRGEPYTRTESPLAERMGPSTIVSYWAVKNILNPFIDEIGFDFKIKKARANMTYEIGTEDLIFLYSHAQLIRLGACDSIEKHKRAANFMAYFTQDGSPRNPHNIYELRPTMKEKHIS